MSQHASPEQSWEILINLNRALLDEADPHLRRTIILRAITDLTDQPGDLWLLKDGLSRFESLPDVMRQSVERRESVSDDNLQAHPLFSHDDEFIGVVCGAFTALNPSVTKALLAQLQLACAANARETRVAQLTAIAEVSQAIASELDLDRLLQLVADVLDEKFGYPFVHIFIVQPERRWIEFKVGAGLYAKHLRDELSFDIDDQDGIIPWVARNGRSALINNVYEDTRFSPLSLPDIEIRSELTVPLVYGGNVLGVFDVESEAFDAFTADDQWLLETLAANIAVALRNAILFRSERWRRKAADSLREIAGVVRTSETLDNTLTEIFRQLASVLPFTVGAIWLKTDDGYRLKSGYHLPDDAPAEAVTHPWLDKIVVAQEALIWEADVDSALPMADAFLADHSAVGAALEVDNNVLGVMTLVHRQPNRFGREARQLLEIFANQAAIVIENTDLYHQAQEQAWVSTALLQVAQATRNLRDLSEVLDAVTRITPMIAGVDACAIWLKPVNGEGYRCAVEYGFSDEAQAFVTDSRLAAENFLVIQLAILKEPIAVTPGDSSNRLPDGFELYFDDQNVLFLPLLSQGELNGIMMMALASSQKLTEERCLMLSGIAYQTASAVQTAQLIEAQQAEAYVSMALLQVAQAVVIPSDIAEALDAVTRIAPMFTGVSQCLVFLYSGDADCTLAAAHGLKEISLPIDLPVADSSEFTRALTDGETCTLTDVAQLPLVLREPFSQSMTTDFFNGLILPLSVQGNIVGALLVADDRPRPILADKRRDILTGIAYQISLAIDNARLYAKRTRQEQLERELQLAQEIQQAFIPQDLPELPGWELASFWKMAREVGGDFFDVITLPDGKLLIIIADVADKGLPASLFMTGASSIVRALSLEMDQPAEILSRANYLLMQDSRQSMFVTAFCAVLEPQSGCLTFACAGHNRPLWLRRDGSVTQLSGDGVVLGVTDTIEFEQKCVTLQPDEGVLFYTDGVTEAFNVADEMFSEERLIDAMRHRWSLPEAEVVQGIYQDVKDFSLPRPQSDDFTLLLLRKTAEPC